MEKKKKKRSLEEIFQSLKEAEKEFDEKLIKYGLNNVKQKEKEEGQAEAKDQNQEDQVQNEDSTTSTGEEINDKQDAA